MVRQILVPVIVFAALGASPSPLTPAQIVARMSANTAGLSSYQVSLQIVAHVRKGGISVPVTMNGDRYFKAPDRGALKIKSGIPAVAKEFTNTYASLGTPSTWSQTYNVTSQTRETIDGRDTYALTATYKRESNVDHIHLNVDATTFDPVRVQWFYRNGSNLVMRLQEGDVGGKYRLPLHEDIDGNFPSYRGTASVTYGTYAINVPIDDSVFAGQTSSSQ
jgi:outer membrane lipoprotein-sorting protein